MSGGGEGGGRGGRGGGRGGGGGEGGGANSATVFALATSEALTKPELFSVFSTFV